MDGLPSGLVHLLWIVPLILLLLFLVSPRFRGDIAETRVRRLLAQGLDARHYTVLNQVRIPSGGGSILLDHVVVSKFGVFVIASQYARGEVSGGEFQDRWKQQYLGRISRFDNPVHRSRMQTESLQRLLSLPAGRFKTLVILCGHSSIRGEAPSPVLPAEKLVWQLRKFSDHCLDEEQVAAILQTIREAEIPQRDGVVVDVWLVVRWALFGALLVGAWLAFRDDLAGLMRGGDAMPGKETRTEQELWEDSLVCAWSEDTRRCACYEPSGARAQLSLEDCKRLAQKGSILSR